MAIRFCRSMVTKLGRRTWTKAGNRFGRGVLILCGLVASSSVFAFGTCQPSGARDIVISIPSPITVPPGTAVGQVIGNTSGYAFNSQSVMRCTYTDIFHPRYAESVMWGYLGGEDSLVRLNALGLSIRVYRTNVPGVGIAVAAQDPNRPMVALSDRRTVLYGTTQNKPGAWGANVRVFLVAIGPTVGGTIRSQEVATFDLRPLDLIIHNNVRFIIPGVVINAPLKPTCSVTTSSVPMSLGQVTVSAFKGVGSHAGSATESIRLNCGGGGGSTLDVFVTVTDQTQPANRTDVLSLAGGSTADGVALQLLRGPTLIRYGADSSAIGNPNQWLAGSTGNGTFTIPLTARYIQTGSSITPGTANGVATFTMAYR